MSKTKQQIAALRRENRNLKRQNKDLQFLLQQSFWHKSRYKEAFRKLGGHQQPADFWDSIYEKIGPQPKKPLQHADIVSINVIGEATPILDEIAGNVSAASAMFCIQATAKENLTVAPEYNPQNLIN